MSGQPRRPGEPCELQQFKPMTAIGKKIPVHMAGENILTGLRFTLKGGKRVKHIVHFLCMKKYQGILKNT